MVGRTAGATRHRGWLGALGAAVLVTAGTVAPAAAQLSPPITAGPPKPLPSAAAAGTTTTPPTAPPAAPPSTAPPTTPATEPPTTTTQPAPTTTTAASPEASTTTAPPDTATTTTAPGAVAAPTITTTTTTSKVPSGPPPASLSESSVSSILNGLARSSANTSTQALIDALRPLQDYGLTLDQALMAGMGRFPVGGAAYFRDDFGEPRETPEAHSHQGNDIFAQFGTPVRSPANGVVTVSNEPVGGKCVYVTEADGTWYYMAHLRGFAAELSNGATVRIGQLVGYTGDTGNAAGGPPHVHFELHPRGGAAISPFKALAGWLQDALAAAPELVASYQTTGLRPITAVGIARHLDQGVLVPPPRLVGDNEDERAGMDLAMALVEPLTPAVLNRSPAPDDSR